jgi:hypothetical protein
MYPSRSDDVIFSMDSVTSLLSKCCPCELEEVFIHLVGEITLNHPRTTPPNPSSSQFQSLKKKTQSPTSRSPSFETDSTTFCYRARNSYRVGKTTFHQRYHSLSVSPGARTCNNCSITWGSDCQERCWDNWRDNWHHQRHRQRACQWLY